MSYQILLIYSHCIYICVCACVWVRGMCISWHISGSQKTTLCFSPHLLLTIFLACFSIAEAQGPFASCDSLVFSFQFFSSGSLELWICSLLYPDFYMGSRNGILGCLLCSKRHWAIFSALKLSDFRIHSYANQVDTVKYWHKDKFPWWGRAEESLKVDGHVRNQ